MTIEQIMEKVTSSEYDFLRTREHLGDNIILLGLGGSHAYGTDNENSDLDVRGIATNTRRYILTGRDFEQSVNTETDTTIYSFDKMIKLLCNCNPNTIEILGLKPEHYLRMTQAGKMLVDNRGIFLSQIAVHSFGGYANSQLRRLENKSARLASQEQQEKNILKSIENASVYYKQHYFHYPDDAIRLFIDDTDREGYNTEIFMDVHLSHYPLRDYTGMWSEMQNIAKAYASIGRRNEKAIAHDKLGKHMCHLVRLYLMCFDILEKGEINTFRDKDHDLLMSIRNGMYLDENRQPIPEFYEMVSDLEKRLDYDKANTDLPPRPDMEKVYDLAMAINEGVCRRGINVSAV